LACPGCRRSRPLRPYSNRPSPSWSGWGGGAAILKGYEYGPGRHVIAQPDELPTKGELAALYRAQWHNELDQRAIKSTMRRVHLERREADFVRCYDHPRATEPEKIKRE
jgi:hypothetical protein